MTVDATICEGQDKGGQTEVPSRDGAGSATVRHALAWLKRSCSPSRDWRAVRPCRERMRSRHCHATASDIHFHSGIGK